MTVSPFSTAIRPSVELETADPASDSKSDSGHALLKSLNALLTERSSDAVKDVAVNDVEEELRKESVLRLKESVPRTFPKISGEDVARAFGFTLDDREWFPCPMPGHDGIASFDDENQRNQLELQCDCHGIQLKGSAWRTTHNYALSDAFYAITSGKVLDRSNSKVKGRLVWRLLLLAEIGIREDVDVAVLPADAHPDLHRARRLVVMLAGVRLALADQIDEAPLPMPLGEALVRDYCNVRNPRSVIGGLISAGVLRHVGNAPLARRQSNPAFLYEPVSQAGRSASNDLGTRPCLSQPSSHSKNLRSSP
jgi:hypothetical protein